MAKAAFIVGYGAYTLHTLRKVLSEEAGRLGLEAVAVSNSTCESELDFIKEADSVFIHSYELPSRVVEALRSSHGRIVALSEPYASLSTVSVEVAAKAEALYVAGGEGNLRKLVRLMAKLAGLDVEVGEVEEVPWHGVYHPRLGVFTRLKEYLESYQYSSRPLVGVLFPRSWWLYGRCRPVDGLVEALESEGLGAVPVFTYGYRSALSGVGFTKEDSIRGFFFLGGRPIIDALVNLYFFFLLDHGPSSKQRFEVVSGVELLRRLGVPIIQAVSSFYRSVEEWVKDEKGIDYLSQVYCVMMPEVDGLVEPIYLVGSRSTAEGVKEYEAFEDHLRYIARRARRWVELKRRRPEERRVAIVLINPPCKGLEANVAVGLGLDVPESVVKLLWELKRRGYDVGDDLPRSGEELAKLILERRAVSEFRWTSVDEVVKRGGAAGFVDLDTYMKWFEELPSKAREEMVKEWGDPRDVLAGRAAKELVGMVYDGKFVIPGLILNKVFITPQPKFGCAGPACDGKVCRILHNPTIPPPHQWLAVYRWITRVFKADVLIHFGTHGYLEFRPGKGVGLSPACWPEASIDDVPHLYVYVVSNPMEGVVAKRRSYAVLVDHLYPPMSMADVLDELDDLLNQYARARQLGEYERAKVVYEKLMEAARRHNIPVSRVDDPERAVEEVHRYVDVVRGSQVNMGLHVFGEPCRDLRRLSEYVVTAMSYDTHRYPSIKRVLAEYLGLDYEELRGEPLKVNEKWGLTNRELLDKLHVVAVNVLERLLAQGSCSSASIAELVDEEVAKLLG